MMRKTLISLFILRNPMGRSHIADHNDSLFNLLLRRLLLKKKLVLILFLSLQISNATDLNDKKLNETAPIKYLDEVMSVPDAEYAPEHLLLVDKSERKLFLFKRNSQGMVQVDEFPTDIGKKSGAKVKVNDHRTPEGIYFFNSHLLSPKDIPFKEYGKMAFTTDYPNFFDRLDKKTGYGIWLHSIPEDVPLTRGSRGCVVVRNEVIQLLSEKIELAKTPLIIKDKVETLTKENYEKRRVQVLDFLKEWKNSWESQNVESYLSFYDNRFSAPGFNYESWIKHKTKLKNLYKFIKVDFVQPMILRHKDQIVVKARQDYQSDLHSDSGLKTLYLLDTPNGLKILREEWSKLDPKIAQKKPANF